MIIMIITSTMAMTFMYSKVPIILAIIVAAQSIMLSFIIYTHSITSWFSFLLLVVFLSGMMVMFVYMSSLAPNELHSPNMFNYLMYTFSLFISMMIQITFNFQHMYSINLTWTNMNLSSVNNMIYKTYSTTGCMLTTMLILLLLIMLMIVVKTMSYSMHPLRSKK